MASTAPAHRAVTPTGPSPSGIPSSQAPSPPTARPFAHHHSHSATTQHAGMSSSASARIGEAAGPGAKYRASVDAAGRSGALAGGAGGSASANWRAVSPGRASTGGVGLSGLRPNSELLGASQASNASQGFQSAETEAIDRWFEDLQHYEATLEEMAAASLDPNFKEELGAIEQWFRVLSEAERTAALYSLLQSSTQMQMRFFITVLQQMARQDPMQAALLSPANPSQLSLEAQMEAKLASLGLKSPASPVVRQFARQSLGVSGRAPQTDEGLLSPNPQDGAGSGPSSLAQSTLANQRAKLKASSRTSAPANLLLGAANNASLSEGLKSPLWSKEETLRERSPSPRPKSTGSTTEGNPAGSQSAQPASSASFLRSPGLDQSNFDAQLSPLVGGSWASMVNTPLVPMFGKDGERMEPGNFGQSVTSNLDGVGQRLGNWGSNSVTSPNPNGGIVLDDVRKFRRSARVSGGGLSGGALGGMYEEATSPSSGGANGSSRADSAATAQKRVQDQLHAVQQLKNMQQSAMNLGLGGLPQQPHSPNTAASGNAGVNGSRVNASGALSSPGLQQTAMAAQQNWRNANAAHLPPTSPQQGGGHNGHFSPNGGAGAGFSGLQGGDAFAHPGGLGVSGLASPSLGGVGGQQAQVQAQAQAQLASLLALQQQMMQQQQQLQSLASGVGLNVGGLGVGGLNGIGMNAGLGVGAIGGMGGVLGQQLSPRLGGGGNGGFGLGFGGMPSPRRSPRPNDRSPHLSSRPNDRGGANPQQTPGSGQNPDEPLDMALLGDTPAWLRSLRLHKYTPNFEGVSWKEMVAMGDKDLEHKGVSALGARRKLLKVFEVVRQKTGIAAPADPSPSSSADDASPEATSPALDKNGDDEHDDE
ncbi:hypothetical protein JCM10213_006080 [Rhodosporidiobolus nylandii]